MAFDPAVEHRAEGVFLAVQADPLATARVIARAMKRQSRGAKLSFLRLMAEGFAEHETKFLAEAAAELKCIEARETNGIV